MKRYLVALLSGALLGLSPLSLAAQAAPAAPEKDAESAWSAPQQRAAAAATPVTTRVVTRMSASKALHDVKIDLVGRVDGQHPEDMQWYQLGVGTVTLHRSWKGTKRWVKLGAKAVDPESATFAFAFPARRNAAYRVTFSGAATADWNFKPSASTRNLGVARRFNESITKRSLIFRGRIVPSFARKAVVIERRTCATCKWKRYAKVRTDGRSRWSKKVAAPRALGQRWYFRAVTPPSKQHIRSYSRTAETFRTR